MGRYCGGNGRKTECVSYLSYCGREVNWDWKYNGFVFDTREVANNTRCRLHDAFVFW